jgi:hypothetical protein
MAPLFPFPLPRCRDCLSLSVKNDLKMLKERGTPRQLIKAVHQFTALLGSQIDEFPGYG